MKQGEKAMMMRVMMRVWQGFVRCGGRNRRWPAWMVAARKAEQAGALGRAVLR